MTISLKLGRNIENFDQNMKSNGTLGVSEAKPKTYENLCKKLEPKKGRIFLNFLRREESCGTLEYS